MSNLRHTLMKRFNKILTVNKWVIGISVIFAVINPTSMPIWYLFSCVTLPIIGCFSLVSWAMRSRNTELALLVTGIYMVGLLAVLFGVILNEMLDYHA